MSDYRERQDEERRQLMELEDGQPATGYEAFLADLGRPDFERPFVAAVDNSRTTR